MLWQLASGLPEYSIGFWLAGFLMFLWSTTDMGMAGYKHSERAVSHRLQFDASGCWIAACGGT